jgi:ketosteroid isomerase-like protein
VSTELDAVRKASEAFYAAINSMVNGDTRPMNEVWSHGRDITAMHPIGGRIVGWDKVRKSFEDVAHIASDGRVNLDDQSIHVQGDLAYELGTERGHARFAGRKIPIDHRVTNVYRCENGAWKIMHHHTDIAPAMVDAVQHATVKA